MLAFRLVSIVAREEIIILRKEIADSDDIKDGSDDVTVVHEDRKEVHAVEVPSAVCTRLLP